MFGNNDTIRLLDLMKSVTQYKYDSVKDIITNARPFIFNFSYPIFDEAYRETLEKLILHHYFMYHIGTETPQLFREYLEIQMNEEMPYFNQLYKSALLEFNPLYSVNMERKTITKADSTGKTNSVDIATGKTDSLSHNLSSDTPQGSLTDIDSGKYLSGYDKIDNSATTSGTQTNVLNNSVNNLNDYTETIKGKESGQSYSSLLLEFRTTFLNIDKQVIELLENNFIQVY